MTTTYGQEQRVLVTVSFDIFGPIAESFDRWDGGDVDSNTKQYQPGGGVKPAALPGAATVGDVTVSRGWRADRDAVIRTWMRAHIGAWATLGYQPLDYTDVPIPGALETYRAVLKGVNALTADSSGDNVLMLPIVFTIDGLPA